MEYASIVPRSTATNSLNFVKHHPPFYKDRKTVRPISTANLKFPTNFKSSAPSPRIYVTSVVIQDTRE